MKIYTKTGDRGETGLYAGPRVPKDHVRIDAYGTIDELNAVLGVARAGGLPEALDSVVGRLQNDLFSLGAELATPDPDAHGTRLIEAEQVVHLEREIDRLTETVPPLKQFILPAGTLAAAQLHLARTVARRAERAIVRLHRDAEGPLSEHLLGYVNRLSDLLFVLARAANVAASEPEVPWVKP